MHIILMQFKGALLHWKVAYGRHISPFSCHQASCFLWLQLAHVSFGFLHFFMEAWIFLLIWMKLGSDSRKICIQRNIKHRYVSYEYEPIIQNRLSDTKLGKKFIYSRFQKLQLYQFSPRWHTWKSTILPKLMYNTILFRPR